MRDGVSRRGGAESMGGRGSQVYYQKRGDRRKGEKENTPPSLMFRFFRGTVCVLAPAHLQPRPALWCRC